jgi:hypothetical protein
MRLDTTITRYDSAGPEPVGTLIWDSETGELGGTLAGTIRAIAREAKRSGVVALDYPIPSSWEFKVKDPLRFPAEFTALLLSLHFDVPGELRSYVPDPPFRSRNDPTIVY